jgi:serine phosphatase RsbU (regulator of sigma subunit)
MTITDPLQLSGDRLALLYRLSQTFNSSLDLDEVLNRVMDEVIAITGAERGFVMLRDEPEGDLIFRVARGMDQRVIEDPPFQVSRGVVERVAHEGQPVLTSDAQHDDRFSMRSSVTNLRLRSILCVPLTIKGAQIAHQARRNTLDHEEVADITHPFGVIYVDNRLRAGIFTQDDLELLTAIASSAAIALENARLYQVAVEKGRLERELQMAREVQANLLPREIPELAGWAFVARWKPARTVAGDYYDFIPQDKAPQPDGTRGLGVVIADVTDKGMPAALFMALTRSTVRASVNSAPSPAEGIARANRLICADATGGMFVTLFYALLNPRNGDLTYVNAGHNPPLLYRKAAARRETQLGNNHGIVRLDRTGIALGVLPDASYEQRTVHLEPGDFLVLYTDGVTDAAAADVPQTTFGMERLQSLVFEHRRATAAEIMAALESAIDDFTGADGATAPIDDTAMMVIKCL